MRKKRTLLTIFVMIILAIVMLSGCATQVVNYVDDPEDDSPIRIYVLSDRVKGFIDYLDNLIYSDFQNGFNYSHDYRLRVTCFEDADTMYTQILDEMFKGGGPDIIVINSLSGRYLNVDKLTPQNAFADLDILLENNGNIDLNDYNTEVMDTGIIHGKRVILPVGYNVNYTVGIQECFDEHNLEAPKEMSMTSYLDTLEEYYKKSSLSPAMLGIEESYLISQFFEMGGELEKSDELRRLLDVLKIEHQRNANMVMHDLRSADFPKRFIDEHGWFYDNGLLFMDQTGQRYMTTRRFHLHYNTIETYWGRNMVWFPQPFREDHPVEAYVEHGFAINNNSKHKNEAFEFIELVLSETRQFTAHVMHYPVRLDAYQKELEVFTKGLNLSYPDYWGIGGAGYPHPDYIPDEKFLPTKMADEFLDYVTSPEKYTFMGHFDYIYYNVMEPSIKDYYKGHMSFDALVEEINDKLVIYYSE